MEEPKEASDLAAMIRHGRFQSKLIAIDLKELSGSTKLVLAILCSIEL